MMTVCEFCLQYEQGGKCRLGLDIRKAMRCREFGPGIERSCSNPKDFVGSGQIIRMATFFGIKGLELKKGQVKRLNKKDAIGQAKFAESLSQIAAQVQGHDDLLAPKIIFATQPCVPLTRPIRIEGHYAGAQRARHLPAS